MVPAYNNNREVKIPKRDGTEFVAKLPAWADSRAQVRVQEDPTQNFRRFIILTQPDHPPHYLNERTGKWKKIG